MKSAILAIIFAATTFTAAAQDPRNMPKPAPYKDKNGNTIGTVATWQNKMYVRDLNGEPLFTIVLNQDGSTTMYDPNGKILDQRK